ncbi:MAG: triose-phosphate isomerase, partial [Elusimicrobia bacterium RIFOXYB2_FULL_49_7]
MRKRIIAGNWKMNKTLPEAVALAKEVVKLSAGADNCEVVICPTFVCLSGVNQVLSGSNVQLGAQDVHFEEKGAFTGKVSCDMLKSVGVKYVIIGHSEQRTYFHETNETVNKKVKAVLKAGLLPIICVGETLAEREADKTEKVVEDHVRGAYAGLSKEDALKTVIAY